MKKKIIIIGIVLILLVLLVPIPRHLKDGGTVEYQALTYKITKVHSLTENGYDKGLKVEILGQEIFSNVSQEKEENKQEENKELKEENNYSTIIDNIVLDLNIPNDWKYEEEKIKEDNPYIFALKLFKDEKQGNATLYYYKKDFGYCGTGRRNEEIILNNGEKAEIGYYEGDNEWNDISFYDIDPNIAIINNGLIGNEADEVLEFIKTFEIEKLTNFILNNFNKISEVSDKTSSNPYDYMKNDYYENIVNLGKNAVSTLETMYKNGKLTGVNAYLSALAIQDITKCNLYEKYGYDWSTAEEFYKLWKDNNCSYKNR